MNKAFDLILERLEELHERYINQYGVIGGNPMAFSVKECLEIVQEVAEEYNDGWIPCSERLPENIFTVIIQVKEMKKPTFGWYENITGWILTEQDLELKGFTVIAWQPLPEPYKERESE